MAIWRAMGASPSIIIGLLMIEAFIIAVLSAIVSTILLFVLLYLLQPWIDNNYGILVNIEMLSLQDIFIFGYFIIVMGDNFDGIKGYFVRVSFIFFSSTYFILFQFKKYMGEIFIRIYTCRDN